MQHNQLQHLVRVLPKRSDELTVQQRPPTPTPAPAPTASAGTATDHLPGQGGGQVPPPGQRRGRHGAPLAAAPAPDLLSPVDVIVTEIFDSELLGEGLLPTLRHAVSHLLRPGGVLVPARAALFGQLVQCPTLAAMAHLRPLGPPPGPRVAAQPWPPDVDCSSGGGSWAGWAGPGQRRGPGAGGPGGLWSEVFEALGALDAAAAASRSRSAANGSAGPPYQRLQEVHAGPLRDRNLLQPLSAPAQLLAFDLARPPGCNAGVSARLPVTHPGQVHAVLLWWQLQVDQRAEVWLSTAPSWVWRLEEGGDGDRPAGSDAGRGEGGVGEAVQLPRQQWRDHWKQCWAAVAGSSGEATEGMREQVRGEREHVRGGGSR